MKGSRPFLQGFTLMELLVVVLILAILMAVALPLYLRAAEDSARKVCRANMQTIANAVQAARAATRERDFGAFVGDLTMEMCRKKLKDLPEPPRCPGTPPPNVVNYRVEASPGPFTVRCLVVAGHGTFTPGADSE